MKAPILSSKLLIPELLGLNSERRTLKPSRAQLSMWELPKIRGALFWGPNKDPTIWGTILGSIYGKLPCG